MRRQHVPRRARGGAAGGRASAVEESAVEENDIATPRRDRDRAVPRRRVRRVVRLPLHAAHVAASGRDARPVLRLPSCDGFGRGASAPGMAEAAAEAASRPEGWGGERIFTRVHPEHRGTSMLIHVQSGWTTMKAALLAKHPARAGGRYEVYVCTLSEPTYAAEIWSLLDATGQLIEDQSKRIVCVPPSQKKSLTTMLAGRAPQHLAVIVDDRPGIWVDEDRKQVRGSRHGTASASY